MTGFGRPNGILLRQAKVGSNAVCGEAGTPKTCSMSVFTVGTRKGISKQQPTQVLASYPTTCSLTEIDQKQNVLPNLSLAYPYFGWPCILTSQFVPASFACSCFPESDNRQLVPNNDDFRWRRDKSIRNASGPRKDCGNALTGSRDGAAAVQTVSGKTP